ncbi:DUF2190 family protein [Rhodobacter capsulatus]|uniref:Predicted phage recombinase, RecA/RadA family n=1 Tax=Rhodobacter capsulatus TaxID=1061 RepID=A0A1G7C3W9_RHOCA|nr:DUF2190 family protein [Rhodobacter capsulatus]WER08941.1 DUF2190 family protein [Rhodobacter capsulatus]SDE33999.1 Predicted phage recombinase, RecA/RadA family [Rhodobacter capsulatus]
MKNYLHSGDVLSVPTPAAVSSGGVVIVGQIKGIAVTDAASGALVAVQTRGVFTLPKEAALAVTLGAAIYWDATPGPGVATTTASGNPALGFATAAADAAAATVEVKIG